MTQEYSKTSEGAVEAEVAVPPHNHHNHHHRHHHHHQFVLKSDNLPHKIQNEINHEANPHEMNEANPHQNSWMRCPT